MYLPQITWPAAALLLTRCCVSSLKVASNLEVLEWTPELIAKEDFFAGSVTIVSGGIPSLASDASVDLGANSETQLLRQFATHRNLRTVITTAEVSYRIVASRKAGIAKLEDLKGKRIGAFPSTSSEYFVQTYLATIGLKPSDYTIVPGGACLKEPCGAGTFPAMLRRGAIDAIGMWEPSVQLGADALGASDAVLFGGPSNNNNNNNTNQTTTYREIYNLATTAEKLADPAKRREIVAFLRALVAAEAVFTNDPDKVVARAAAAVGTDAALFRAVWPVHMWSARNPPDLLDVLVEEDKYVAARDRRAAMSREVLAALVDTSVLEEAMAMEMEMVMEMGTGTAEQEKEEEA
ncbi:periplasmic binding protein-like II [Xylaria cf. heliscus]|nr:periplasmic binding protein-like II [Xylaria cf. heliscus]